MPMRPPLAALLRPLLALRVGMRRFFGMADWQLTLLWAIVAGALGALATEVFRLALHALDRAVLGEGEGLVALARSLPMWARIATPTVGGLVAGLLLVLARRATAQKATSDYMEAIVVGDGKIPVTQTLVRSASSLVSIASGGSIGREGSMVQLSALCASLLGQIFRFPGERLRLLVACGAAAGLTAAYNAPIAGAFFVAEIVLGSIAMESVGPIIVAAVVANIVMREMPGYQPVYQMPVFPDVAGAEVLLFALLGVLLGGAAAVFLRALAASRQAFARLPVALPWRLALGGLAVGVISVFVPEVWGNGYSVVNAGIGGNRLLGDDVVAAFGERLINRFDRDALKVTGASHVIVLIGINDIGIGAQSPRLARSAAELQAGLKTLVEQARAAHIKIFLGTVPPFEGASYYSTEGEAKRQALNTWIRGNSAQATGIVDFDAATRDPALPTRLLALYDSGDQLHPSDKGYEAMSQAVDLAMLR